MIKYIKYALLGLALVGYSFSTEPVETLPLKCLVQLINYEGEGAYVIVSVVDKEGKYLETLRVLGDDPEWYHDIPSWWNYYGKKRYNLDGITGATISGGERSVFQMAIKKEHLSAGNTLRFETAVEEQEYYEIDAEIALGAELSNAQTEGSGYIRYVRLITNK
ncbi:MAG: DUF2271 domain-containing protein [Saprospiraceae bacterium]|nr:DUF2271 domain-containing protein [Saprospiraceae bacterium]